MGGPCGVLLADIGEAITAIGDGLALFDHPAIQILGADEADGQGPAVTVLALRVAADRLLEM